MIAFAQICESQTIRLVEKLADGSYIVSIDGAEFRAISGEKAIEIAKRKLDLEMAQKVNAELTGQVKEALLERDLAKAQMALVQQKSDSFEADFKRARDDAARNFSLFQSERELRIESSQFIPHGSVKGFWGKVLTALDSGPSQAAFKIGLPVLNTLRCQR